jgi:hypothetical protein
MLAFPSARQGSRCSGPPRGQWPPSRPRQKDPHPIRDRPALAGTGASICARLGTPIPCVSGRLDRSEGGEPRAQCFSRRSARPASSWPPPFAAAFEGRRGTAWAEVERNPLRSNHLHLLGIEPGRDRDRERRLRARGRAARRNHENLPAEVAAGTRRRQTGMTFSHARRRSGSSGLHACSRVSPGRVPRGPAPRSAERQSTARSLFALAGSERPAEPRPARGAPGAAAARTRPLGCGALALLPSLVRRKRRRPGEHPHARRPGADAGPHAKGPRRAPPGAPRLSGDARVVLPLERHQRGARHGLPHYRQRRVRARGTRAAIGMAQDPPTRAPGHPCAEAGMPPIATAPWTVRPVPCSWRTASSAKTARCRSLAPSLQASIESRAA